jgi:hypothetical protein
LKQNAASNPTQVIAATLGLGHIQFQQPDIEQPLRRRKHRLRLRRKGRSDNDFEKNLFELFCGFLVHGSIERDNAAKDRDRIAGFGFTERIRLGFL